MSSDLLPPLGDFKQRPFIVEMKTVNQIAVTLSAYLLLAIYPAYGLLRLVWAGNTSAFSPSGIAIAVLISVLFGIYARRTMWRYLRITPSP